MFVMLCVAYTCLVSPLAESWYGVGPVYICERMDTFLCVCLFLLSVCPSCLVVSLGVSPSRKFDFLIFILMVSY